MWWCWRFWVYSLVLCTGYWQLGQTCNTRKEECNRLKTDALEKVSAQDRCSGLETYVVCVREDVADCEDQSSDQYAVNLKSLYCNKAYLCSVKLKECYVKFTRAMKRTIENSDNATRSQICRELMTEILTCQERVMSDCQGQPGLMETVKQYQMALDTVCNNTDPCVDTVLQCQRTIFAIGAQDTGASAGKTPPLLSNCTAQTPIDYCGAYRQAASCVRASQSSCGKHLTVNNTLANLETTITEVCDPVVTCGQNMSTCMCHINRQSLDSPLAIMTTICSTFPPFERCLKGLAPACYDHQEVRKEISGVTNTYQDYHTLYCTTQRGLCPATLQCLAKLPREDGVSASSSSDPNNDMYTSVFHITSLCSGANSLFRCLQAASTQCQSEASDVTFSMLEDNFLDMCGDIGPHRQKLGSCASLTRCLREFDSLEPSLSANGKSGDSSDTVRQKFASLTKTQFWCKYLLHGLQCLKRTAGECALSDQLKAESIQRYNDLQRECQAATTTPNTGTKKPNGVTVSPSKGKNHGTRVATCKHWWSLPVTVVIALTLRLPFLH